MTHGEALARVLVLTCSLVERRKRPVKSPFAETAELVKLGLLQVRGDMGGPLFEPTANGWRCFEAWRGVTC